MPIYLRSYLIFKDILKLFRSVKKDDVYFYFYIFHLQDQISRNKFLNEVSNDILRQFLFLNLWNVQLDWLERFSLSLKLYFIVEFHF